MYTISILLNFYLIISVFTRILPQDTKISFNTADNQSEPDSGNVDDDEYSVLNDSEYGPIFLDNYTDPEDELKGPYKHDSNAVFKLLSITLPTTIAFLVLMLCLCLVCRPKTHFISHFKRPKYEMCRHQKKTHEAYRKKYAPTPEEVEQKLLDERAKQEARVEEIKEKRRRAVEKKIEAQRRKSEKRHQKRLEFQEKSRIKHVKRLERMKLQREKDILKKIRKKALLEERRDEILEREGREPRIDRFKRSKQPTYGSGRMLKDEDKFLREEALRKSNIKDDQLSLTSKKSSDRVSFIDLRGNKSDERTTRVRGPPRERHYD